MKSKVATIFVIFSIIISIAFTFAMYFAGQEIYNDGICQNCGGHYRIVGTPTHRHHFYVYECDQCGDSFQTTALMHKSGK